MVTKFVWVVTYCEKLPPMNSYDKLSMSYLHLQKTHEHQTRQATKLPREAPTLKVT